MWITYALLSLLSWGLWGLLIKVALKNIQWFQYYLYGNIVPLIVCSILIAYYKDSLHVGLNNLWLILIASLSGTLGYLFFIFALKDGPSIVVVPLTALYPAITMVLAYILLHERVAMHQWIGLIFAIVAIVLVSIEEI